MTYQNLSLAKWWKLSYATFKTGIDSWNVCVNTLSIHVNGVMTFEN